MPSQSRGRFLGPGLQVSTWPQGCLAIWCKGRHRRSACCAFAWCKVGMTNNGPKRKNRRPHQAGHMKPSRNKMKFASRIANSGAWVCAEMSSTGNILSFKHDLVNTGPCQGNWSLLSSFEIWGHEFGRLSASGRQPMIEARNVSFCKVIWRLKWLSLVLTLNEPYSNQTS